MIWFVVIHKLIGTNPIAFLKLADLRTENEQFGQLAAVLTLRHRLLDDEYAQKRNSHARHRYFPLIVIVRRSSPGVYGNTGKTTTRIPLTTAFGRQDKRILLMDVDFQANISKVQLRHPALQTR
ncbi:MAG: hypothetical protein K8L99_09270 [Anaerolineae bacterium]|nr:hypothetical protein [Anaerolineae bacterium]